MVNSLSIQAGLPIRDAGDSTVPSRVSTSAPVPAPVTAKQKPVALFVNPTFRFDPTVGIEVIEFHDDMGKVSNSIPSQRQLEAYHTHQQTPPGEEPPPAPSAPDGKASAG